MASADKDGSDYRATLVKYWMEKAWESFEAAKYEYKQRGLNF